MLSISTTLIGGDSESLHLPCCVFCTLQGVAKHVAKPTSNIKLMLMSRGDPGKKKKKKEVGSRGLASSHV